MTTHKIQAMTQEDMNTDTLERQIQTCLLTDTCAVAGRLSNEVVRYVSQIVSIAQRFSLFFSGMSKFRRQKTKAYSGGGNQLLLIKKDKS